MRKRITKLLVMVMVSVLMVTSLPTNLLEAQATEVSLSSEESDSAVKITAYSEEESVGEESAESEMEESVSDNDGPETDGTQQTLSDGESGETAVDGKVDTFATVEGNDVATVTTDATGEVTRAEWLSSLAETFEMTVEEDCYPDNYFSDLDSSSEYYYDVLLNVEFGVIDVETGGEVRPDDAVTREFAAHTLNYCLGYQVDEATAVACSDIEDSEYQDDLIIAVNRGWFALVDGLFLPEQYITTAEAEGMLADAAEILAGMEVDTDAEAVFELAKDVIEITKECDVVYDEEGVATISISDFQGTIEVGNRFAIYQNDIPTVYVAQSVNVADGVTVITAIVDESEDAYTSIDAEGVVSASVANIEALDGAELLFVDEETNEEFETVEEIIELYGASSKKLTNTTVVVKDEIECGDGVVFVELKLKNAKVTYDVEEQNLSAYAYLECDTELSFGFEGSLGDASPINDVRLINWTIPGVGGFVVAVDLDISGSVAGVQKGYLKTGVDVSAANGVRMITGFKAKSFSFVAKVEADLSLSAKLGLTDLPILKAYIYAKVGGKAEASVETYVDDLLPCTCVDFKAYIYASYGAKGSLKFWRYQKEINIEKEVVNEKNSPIRCVKHYDDGVEVSECGRDATEGDGTSTAKKRYTTPASSAWSGSYWGDGSQSAGKDDSGNIIPLYEYSVNDDGESVTITGYNGSASALVIPDTLDGYDVTVIGWRVFEGNTKLRSVSIPDSVISVEGCAFQNCSKLQSVKLSTNVETIGAKAFGNCDLLESITIPKSLTNGGTYYDGAFYGCTGLKNIVFEDGTTEIATSLFSGCDGLESIVIPDSVTVVESYAFTECIGLKKIVFSKNLTTIEAYAFENCSVLDSVELPDSITSISAFAFLNCAKLENVKLSKNVETIGAKAFGNCDLLESITIPKSLTNGGTYYDGAFYGCTGLKNIVFEDGTTEIATSLFSGCDGLESIVIPDSVTVVESYAFSECTSLKKIVFSKNLTTIEGRAFENCSVLESIELPNSVTDIAAYTFSGCTSLATINLPENVQYIKEMVFMDCGLTQIDLHNNLLGVENGAFYNCDVLTTIDIPNSVTNIGNKAFYDCDALQTVTISDSVTSVGQYAFYDCDALQKVTIPDSVTSLGTYVFQSCDVLSDVTMGMGLTNIPTYTFSDCGKLASVIIPYNVTTINNYAFKNCTSLTEITIPQKTTTISDTAFSYFDGVTVYGVSGTYAETYANEQGMTFVDQSIAAESVTLPQSTYTVNKGSTITLIPSITPTNFTDLINWKSADTSIVTVDENGKVKGVGIGTTTIKVEVGNVSTSCKVTVVQPVTSVSINKSSLSIGALETYQLTATAYPTTANNRTIQWFSSDETIATVSDTGLVTPISKGSCAITAAAQDGSGKKATCTVTVTSNAYIVDNVQALQSSHPYENNCKDIWQYTLVGANGIVVTFDASTCMEDGFDYLYILDGNNTQVGKYTGSELSGATISIPGDTVRIRLETDSGSNEYGFAVSKVEALASVSYTIVYNKNAANAAGTMANQSMIYNSRSPLSANQFTHAGYTFAGWNTQPNGTGTAYANQADGSTLTSTPGATINLYAQWIPVNYTISYNLNGGKNSSNPTTYTIATATITLTNPTKTGYTFGGWYSDSKLTNKVTTISQGSTGNKTLYAKWTANTYKVKFSSNGGKGKMTTLTSVTYGKSYRLKKNTFTKKGYTFAGWNTKKNGKGTTYKNKASIKNLTPTNKKTVTLYAQWKPVNYKITYNLNGGKNSTKNPKKYTVATKTITLKKPTKKGYTFAGWYSDKKLTKKVTKIKKGTTGNIKLYAKWVKK